MPHFFISYAKKDTREIALQLNDALNALLNVTAWVDKSLKAGRSWELQIQTEIDRCDYMIVLYSPDINRHKHGEDESYMLSEIHYAKRVVRKPIIPVMAQKTEPPMSLITDQYIDFTLRGLGLDDLISAICDEAGIALGVQGLAPLPTALSTKPASTKPASTKPNSTSLMPAPFAWMDIPGKGYSIAKYPITNVQFAKFVEVDGYSQQKWWTEAGWAQREKDQWTQPRYWIDKQWNGTEQPVVGVSWYEAVAFCLWLSQTTGENIALPTEDQWQYAALGDDGREYPWGKDWDCKRCNNSVKPCDSNVTTPVRQYEGKGDSPFGVVDMAGNVWEWCLTDYENKTNDVNSIANNRVLRGGSWGSLSTDYFRCVYRGWNYPDFRLNFIGFRVSRFK